MRSTSSSTMQLFWFATSLLLSAAAATTTALQNAIIVVEASHGGAQDYTNTTIKVPLTAAYTNPKVLDAVSALYLIGSTDVTLDSITCNAFSNSNGTGNIGLSFNSSVPSFLSTNTVPVGSIVCVSSDISFAPPGGPPGGPKPLSTSSSSTTRSSNLTRTMTRPIGVTSTLIKTTSAHGAPTTKQLTSTDVVSASTGAGAASQKTATVTASQSPSLSSNTPNVANGMSFGSEFFGGLALFGFAVAFVV